MTKGIESSEAVGSASVRVLEEGQLESRKPIVFVPPNDPELVKLSDADLDKLLSELRAGKELLMKRLRSAVAEYDYRKTRHLRKTR